MDKKYYIEIVPLEKGKDILNSFADHNPTVFQNKMPDTIGWKNTIQYASFLKTRRAEARLR